MFTLYTINETIVIKPSDITEDSNEVLLKALSDKYLFKIFEKEGLCVEIHNFKIKECVIVNGQGDYQYHLEIQIILFRGLKDEVLVGTVHRCLPEGIEENKSLWDLLRLSFQEIISMSQQYSIEKSLEVIISDKKAKVWVWQYPTPPEYSCETDIRISNKPIKKNSSPNKGYKEDQELVYEIGEKIRFKVMSSHYQKGGFEVDEKPYCILGSCREIPLGLLSWWTPEN